MTEDTTALRRQNYAEFIDTIPPDVKKLTGKILGYFREKPVKFNYMFAEETVYIYLLDDEFKTIIDIVDYLGADTDSPPFKPYRNEEPDDIFGDLNFYLKLNQEIIDGSGYFNLVADDAEPVDIEPVDEDDDIPEVESYQSEVILPDSASEKAPVDFEDATEELNTDIPEVEEYIDESEPDSDAYLDEPESVGSSSTGSPEDELYWDNLKLIAKGIDGEALELMKRVHTATGMVVPITVVRIGSKLLIRTFGDQPSFDEHFEAIRLEAEAIFEGATSVTATKNNVQIMFG